MKVLVVGSGGREHALVWKIRQSPRVEKVYCVPGNGGIAADAECVPLAVQDSGGLIKFARQARIDLTVVGPELPLTLGLVDDFEAAGLRAVGPRQKASILEGSKGFAKEFMSRHEIPTARFAIVRARSTAETLLKRQEFQFPVVFKADGLASGKGVFVTRDRSEADAALTALFDEQVFGSAADSVVVEEGLAGREASFICFSDGANILPMVPAQDHKAAFDGDKGPNTGGMGAFSTDQILSVGQRESIVETIVRRAIAGMASEGNPFKGFLYAGLMLTAEGPRVLEFNARMGDPEAQVILPRLKSDLVPILEAVTDGRLDSIAVEWNAEPAAGVVLASKGYPGKHETGKTITGLEMAREGGSYVFHSGTAVHGTKFVTAGGRVLTVSALGSTLQDAVLKVYEAANKIHFEGMHYRRDIAAKAVAESSPS